MARAKAKEAKKDEPAADPEKEYKPTPREAEAITTFLAASEARKPSARLKFKETPTGAFTFSNDHDEPKLGLVLLAQALGTTDLDFANGLMMQVAGASMKAGKPVEADANFMLATIEDIGPRDRVEAMLAAQMAAVHMASMTFARRLANVDNIPQQDSASNAFNKLTRTFVTQMEALKRYRSTGEQRVVVERVTVQAGGQAIVGNVAQGKPANNARQTSPAPLPALAPPRRRNPSADPPRTCPCR